MLWGVRHDPKDLLDEFEGNIRVEQVTHRIDEDDPRLSPGSREVEDRGMDRELETRTRRARVAVLLVLVRAHGLQPLGESQRVTVVTPCRYTITPGRRIPGRLSPLDSAVISHTGSSLVRCTHQGTGQVGQAE